MRFASFNVALGLLVLGACGDGGDLTNPPETGSLTLTVTAEGTGSGRITTAGGVDPALTCDLAGGTSATCAATYAEGTVVALTVTPEANSLFDGWGGDAASCGTTPTCSLTISTNLSVIAVLSSASGSGGVEVASSAFYPRPNFGTDGAIIWVVEVRNTSPRLVESAEIDFTTFDAAGAILATGAAFVGPIPPGETRADQSFADYVGVEASADFSVTDVQFGTGTSNLGAAQIVSSNWRADPASGSDGAVIWTVQVRNTTSAVLGSVGIEFSTYDAAGKIVTAAFTFLDEIAPGETRSAEGYADYHGTEVSAEFKVASVTDGLTGLRARR